MVLWLHEETKHIVIILLLGAAVYFATYLQIAMGQGEEISVFEFREQSLQYQEDMRNTLDDIAKGLCN